MVTEDSCKGENDLLEREEREWYVKKETSFGHKLLQILCPGTLSPSCQVSRYVSLLRREEDTESQDHQDRLKRDSCRKGRVGLARYQGTNAQMNPQAMPTCTNIQHSRYQRSTALQRGCRRVFEKDLTG